MAILSRSDVRHVAHLARLGLSDEEVALLEGQLNHILEQYAVLAQLDTEAIPPTAQVIEREGVMRDDAVRPSLPLEVALANAPRHDAAHIIVPAVIDPGDPHSDRRA